MFEQREWAFLPLPDVPELGDYYADLRLIHPVDRRFLRDDSRLASMTDEATLRLQAQLVGFFTRKRLDDDL